MRNRWVGWSAVGALGVLAAAFAVPGLLGLSTRFVVAQLIALRPLLALGGLLVTLALVAWIVLRDRHGSRSPRLIAAATIMGLFTTLHAGVVLSRGVTADDALTDVRSGDQVNVLSFNTLDAIDGPEAIRALIDEHAADVVMLPETQEPDAAAIAGDDYAMFIGEGRPGGSAPTALLIADDLGEYERVDGPDTIYGMVGAQRADGFGPVFYAVHIASPVAEPLWLWRDELELAMGICDDTQQVVMAGDYNATIDHAPLRDSSCVSGRVGIGGVGTWPTSLPAVLGTPIDHVFIDPRSWSVDQSAVVELPRSDHRGLLVRLSPA